MTYPQQDPTNLITLALFLAPPLLLLIWVIATFNRLVNLRNLIGESWSNVGTELKRRYELIPNLVETVKGYAAHEKEIFQSIAEARARALATVASVTSDSAGTQAASENQLTRGIRQLLAVSEAYPDLKANQNFLGLQEELSSTENKIAFSRQAYNDQVMMYNTKIQMIPSNIVAGFGGFTAMDLFELKDNAQREAPSVKF